MAEPNNNWTNHQEQFDTLLNEINENQKSIDYIEGRFEQDKKNLNEDWENAKGSPIIDNDLEPDI